eukprot:gene8054-10896_t
MALYALCVWPANFKHAIDGIQMPYIGNSWWYHGPRLAFQPVIIWWALRRKQTECDENLVMKRFGGPAAISALLSFNGGFVDTAGFLGLQGLFVAHVTGNFVTLGAALVHGSHGIIGKVLAMPGRDDCVSTAARCHLDTQASRTCIASTLPMISERSDDSSTVISRSHSKATGLSAKDRNAISARAADLVRAVRGSSDPRLMEVFLSAYGLSTKEGVALMCLAEALLRIPDAETRNALIRDKIAHGQWQTHAGRSPSVFVNAATWGLLLTGKLVATHSETGLSAVLTRLIGKGGEPLIRKGVDMAMRMMGEQF